MLNFMEGDALAMDERRSSDGENKGEDLTNGRPQEIDISKSNHPPRQEGTIVTIPTYDKGITALLVVDPYNDFISEGGKIWPRIKAVAEANKCVPNMLEVLNAARRAKLRVFYAMHHRYRPGDYETWKYIAPIQKRAWQGRACAASRRATSASATGQCRSISCSVLSDPRCHRVLSPASAGSHPQIHESLRPKPLQASGLSTGQ